MAVCNITNPVAVSHPLTGQFVTLAKGLELEDKDPLVKAFGWAFELSGRKRGAPERAVSEPDETREA